MADVENVSPLTESPKELKNVTVVEDLSGYQGESLEEKVDSFIQQHPVTIISKTWCPFSLDAKNLISNVLGVEVYSIEVNSNPEGAKIFK
jgi:hypothetical protein